MFRKLFNAIGLLLALAILIFLLTGVLMVCDGLHDRYQKAEMAIVPGYLEIEDGRLALDLTARLDRAAVLYAQGIFPHVVVSGVTPPGEDDETDAMAHYLEARGVPADAITQVHAREKGGDPVDNLARYLKNRSKPVVLICDYYRLPRLKLIAWRAGIPEIQQAHTGAWKKEDILAVLNEDVRIYQDLNEWYVLPAWKEISGMIGDFCQLFVTSVGLFLNPETKR